MTRRASAVPFVPDLNISRLSGGQAEVVRITIGDTTAGVGLVEVELDLATFAIAVTGGSADGRHPRVPGGFLRGRYYAGGAAKVGTRRENTTVAGRDTYRVALERWVQP